MYSFWDNGFPNRTTLGIAMMRHCKCFSTSKWHSPDSEADKVVVEDVLMISSILQHIDM